LSLFALFNIGKSTLFASQTALSVTSHNIANVNTPGFSRQEVMLNVANSVNIGNGYVGRGVTVSGIRRHYDSFIQSQLIDQRQKYGRSSALNNALSQIEQVFNEANNMGISRSLMDYFNAWHGVATNPEGQTQRTVLLQRANALALTAKQMERGILDTLKGTNKEIDNTVNRINSIASDVAILNGKIVQIEAGLGSEKANDLRDQRDNLLNELSNLVEFTSYEDENGSLTIMVGNRNLTYQEATNPLSTKINEAGYKDLYLDGINITANINKGQLGGVISVRDDIETKPLTGIRRLIASLTKEINALHRSGYGLDASTGNDFFNPLQLSTKDYSSGAGITATIADPSQLTLDEYDISFDAGNNYYVYNKQTGALAASGAYNSGGTIAFNGIEMVITGTITATDRFFVSPLTDAVENFGVSISEPGKVAAASSNADLPGDNTNASQIAQLYDSSMTNLGNSTFTNYYSGLVSNVGTMSRGTSDGLKFDENLLSELNNRRESVSGVSLDEEAANLIRFQRSFEAGAKMIKVTDELLQSILNL